MEHCSTAPIWRDQLDPCYNRLGTVYPRHLAPEQVTRAERIRQARLLFANQHRQYYLGEGRTQHKFPEVESDGCCTRPYFMVNVLRLISLKTADLLFGEDPLLRVEDEIQQQKLAALAERTALHPLILKSAIACTHAGECFLEARVYAGQVYLARIPAAEIYPEGPLLPNNEYASYTRHSYQVLADGERPRKFLLETRYVPGAILRQAFELDLVGAKAAEVPLNAALAGKLIFADAAGNAYAAEERTGIAASTIVYVPNFQDDEDRTPTSSYDGVIDLQDNLNALETQINRILEQHADPLVSAPEQQVDDSFGGIRSRKRVLFFRAGEEKPAYIVRDLQLQSVMEKQERTLKRLCILAEMSPSLLGMTDGASAAESWKKFKLSAANAIAMAKRKAAIWRPALRKLMGVAQDLECTIPGVRYDRKPIAAEIRDGIPVDELDTANQIATLMPVGAMSTERAVELQIPDAAAQKKELARIEAMRQAQTPSVLLSPEPGANDETPTGDAGRPGQQS